MAVDVSPQVADMDGRMETATRADSPGQRTRKAAAPSQAFSAAAAAAPAAAKSLQSCPTVCDPIDGSLSDSTILGILQARTLEWVAISFSSA